jgi:hypothetical protein
LFLYLTSFARPHFISDPTDDFYNKPRGLKHWLEFADPPVYQDCVVALIDPDFIFLRPLTIVIDSPEVKNNLFNGKLRSELFYKVVEGRPAAQEYGLGTHSTLICSLVPLCLLCCECMTA